jgi:putative hemolysin
MPKNVFFASDVLVIAVCLVIFAIISLIEAAMMSVDKVHVRTLTEAGDRRAARVERLMHDGHSVLTTLIILINACLLTISGFSTQMALRLWGEHWVPVVSIVMILIILSFFEVAPKALALRYAQPLAFFFARPTAMLVWLFSPLVRLLTGLGRGIIRRVVMPLLGGELLPAAPSFSEAEIKELLIVGQRAGELEPQELEMLDAAIEFADKVTREVMTHRTDMVALPDDADIATAVETGAQSGFSRIPIYHGDDDHIVGILYMRDLLPILAEGDQTRPVASVMRPPYFVPESTEIDELLRDMQGRRAHMAIVIDEYGGVSGLVTIEDLLEEIVGEIRDEYDVAEEEPVHRLDAHRAIALARVSVDEIADQFDLDLPEGEFDTLGGFLLDQLGRLPEVGDHIEVGPVRFEVVEVGDQRIEKVLITRQEVNDAHGESEAD